VRMSRDPERVALELVTAARDFGGELWLWDPKTLQRHLGIVLLPARLSALRRRLHRCLRRRREGVLRLFHQTL
jgi:hypothetical protein